MKKSYSGDRDAISKELLEDMQCMDEPMLKRLQAAEAEADGRVLRYKFVINNETEKGGVL